MNDSLSVEEAECTFTPRINPDRRGYTTKLQLPVEDRLNNYGKMTVVRKHIIFLNVLKYNICYWLINSNIKR